MHESVQKGGRRRYLGVYRRLPFLDRRRALLRTLPRGSVGAEIGVWRGDFSERILRVARPARLHLIDPWRFVDEDRYAQAWYGRSNVASQGAMDTIHVAVLRRFATQVHSGVVVIHRCESAAVAQRFEDDYFDWVYIDGNHLYEYVQRDLEMFAPKVKRGGLIAGDDYATEGWWGDGVRRAVDEFLQSGGCEVVSLDDQFVFKRT